MNKIRVEGKDMYRELGFELNFNAEISYEGFCKNPDFDFIIDKNSKNWDLYSTLTWRGFYSLWAIKGLGKYEDLYNLFLKYKYIEKYENLLDLPFFTDNFSIKNNELFWEDNKGELIKDNNIINFYIEDIKYHVNKNRYFNDGKMHDNLKNPKLVTPYRDENVKTNSSEEELSDLKATIKEKVKLTQTRKEHRLLDYIYFLSITTSLKLVVIIDPGSNKFVITDQNQIDSFKNRFFLSISLTNIILETLTHHSKELITRIKSLHQNEEVGNSMKVFKDLREIMSKNPSTKIAMNSNQYGNNINLDFLIRDQDLNNYEKIKNYKEGEVGVTRSTAIEKHGTHKTAIVSHGRIKYNKDLDNTK